MCAVTAQPGVRWMRRLPRDNLSKLIEKLVILVSDLVAAIALQDRLLHHASSCKSKALAIDSGNAPI